MSAEYLMSRLPGGAFTYGCEHSQPSASFMRHGRFPGGGIFLHFSGGGLLL